VADDDDDDDDDNDENMITWRSWRRWHSPLHQCGIAVGNDNWCLSDKIIVTSVTLGWIQMSLTTDIMK
jgi:hypothetical protein